MILRPMRPADLPAARSLQLGESWNQTLKDWELFLTTTPDGCFVAVGSNDENGQVVGTAASIRYGSQICWISMVLVDPQWRGHGIARALMRQVIAANEDACACIRLDATPAGRPAYERLGFHADYDIERWIRPVARHDMGGGDNRAPCVPLTPAMLPQLCERDREVFGADRSAVLHHLIGSDPRGAWYVPEGDRIRSYVLGRPGEFCYQVGPLVSARDEDTVALLRAVRAAAGRPMVMDIIASNAAIQNAVEAEGFVFDRPLTRMSRGPAVREAVGHVAAIAGPEFG